MLKEDEILSVRTQHSKKFIFVVASSRDGSMKLWDCASQSCITELYHVQNPAERSVVNDCYVAEDKQVASVAPAALSTKDYGTEHKIALCVTEDGHMVAVDVRTRKQVFKRKHKHALNCCLLQQGLAYAGSENGELIKFDLRNVKNMAHELSLGTKAQILCLEAHSDNTCVWFGTADGACSLYNPVQDVLTTSLTGSDYDPIYDLAVAVDSVPLVVLTACRDGNIRRYSL